MQRVATAAAARTRCDRWAAVGERRMELGERAGADPLSLFLSLDAALRCLRLRGEQLHFSIAQFFFALSETRIRNTHNQACLQHEKHIVA